MLTLRAARMLRLVPAAVGLRRVPGMEDVSGYTCSPDCSRCHGTARVIQYPPSHDGGLPFGILVSCPNARYVMPSPAEQVQWGLRYIRRKYRGSNSWDAWRRPLIPPARTRREVLDRTDAWHGGGYADILIDGRESELYEFLGWTEPEYNEYVETGRLPGRLPYEPNRPELDEIPEYWQTLGILLFIIAIGLLIIVLDMGGGA